MNMPKIAIIGATGLVGRTILHLMGEKKFFNPFVLQDSVIAVASDATAESGITLGVFDHKIPVMNMEQALQQKPDIIIMSASEEISGRFAKEFLRVNENAWVIDNSPRWRMDDTVPLTLPHLNWSPNKNHRLIPVPNCVAIMLATVLHPLLKMGLTFAEAAVLQSVSGAGNAGIAALDAEQKSETNERFEQSPFPFPCADNIQPAAPFLDNDFYNVEEQKVKQEIRKLFDSKHKNFPISPACSRNGVHVGHWAHVRAFLPAEKTLKNVQGAFRFANAVHFSYKPTDLLSVVGKDYALVSGLRIDQNSKRRKYKVFEFYVVSDNLRLGSSSTALYCAEKIISKFYK
jgi:aspartate-semialdehyde dehydrogenase